MAADCCVFKFFWHSVDGKHLMHFQSEKAVFKLFPLVECERVLSSALLVSL